MDLRDKRKSVGRLALALLLVAAALFTMFAPPLALAEQADERTPELTTWEDFSGTTVGMVTGAPFESMIREKCPDVGKVVYYSTTSDLIQALRAKKVDAFINSTAVGALVVNRYDDFARFPEPLGYYDIGIAFPKGSQLAGQFKAIIDRLREDGTSDRVWDKWTAGDEGDKSVPEQDWAGANGTLRVAACQSLEPVSYLGNGKLLGFDIEMMLIAAEELDVHLEFEPLEFADVLAYIQSGKADLGCGSILITPERQEAMDFAPTHANDLVCVVRATGGAAKAGAGWIDGIVTSFEKTFIKEDRWKLILSGLGTTAIITLASGALGTALGFASMLLRRSGNRIAEAFVGGFEGLMNRLPIMVVLLVFYYVIFGSANLSGTIVSICAFTLAFGATTGSIMWNAVQAVDAGQSKASLALGFTERQTFFGVVLPQAAHQFLPLLSGQLVSLAKQTSVVGYIAVMDLTRAGDVIRSLTMEAFFPLFCIAAIYFALCCLLTAVMDAIIRKLDFKNKPRTIPGVDL